MLLASGSKDLFQGGSLLLVYGIGMTAPFVMASLFTGPFLRWAARHRRYLGLVEKAMGMMLLLFAALIATGSVEQIAQWMLASFSWDRTLR